MFDTIIFIIILIFMWQGYRRGFVRELPRLISLVGAIIAAVIFYAVIGTILNATPLPDLIGGMTSDSFLGKISAGDDSINQVFAAMTHEPDKNRLIGEFFVKFLALIMIFAATYIILRKVFKKKKLFRKINVVRQLKPALGGVVGLFKGFAYVYIALGFLVMCEPFLDSAFIKNGIDNSQIASFMYDNNYMANIVAQHDYLTSE